MRLISYYPWIRRKNPVIDIETGRIIGEEHYRIRRITHLKWLLIRIQNKYLNHRRKTMTINCFFDNSILMGWNKLCDYFSTKL